MTHWQEIKHSPDLFMIQTAVSTPGMWVLQGVKGIYGYSPETNQIAWEINDIDPVNIPTNHEMAYLNGTVVASVFLGKKTKQGWIFGLDPQTGMIVWQKQARWPSGNSGRVSGLKATKDHIIVVEEVNETPIIVWLDPTTGKTIYETPGIRTNWSGLTTPQNLYYHSGWHGKNNALYRVSSLPGTKLKPAAPIGCQSLVTRDDNLYAYIYRENGAFTNKIIWWKASDFSQYTQMEVPEAQSYDYAQLLPTHHPHRLFMSGRNQCCLFDLETKDVVWEHELSTRISYPSLLPEGIFFSTFNKTTIAYIINEKDGSLQEAPFPKYERIFDIGQHRISGGSFTTHIYAPSSLPIPKAHATNWPRYPIHTLINE